MFITILKEAPLNSTLSSSQFPMKYLQLTHFSQANTRTQRFD